MKLFLASEAKHPDTIKNLEKFVGGLKGKKIAYIVTAANGEGWGSWKDSGTLKMIIDAGADVETIQLEDHLNNDIISKLSNIDILWMAGGMVGYLAYWINRLELKDKIRKILESGVLYVGSSAGSMITFSSLEMAEWYIGETEPGVKHIPGLGLVDFEFYPHYEEGMLPEIKKIYTGKKMYLVKNGEAIIVEDEKVKVIGKERIITNEKNI